MSKFDPEFASGIWPCVVQGASVGEATDKNGKPKGVLVARVNVVIDGGPDKGKSCTYEDEVNPKSSLYIGRSLKNVGWKERSMSTVESDVAAWVKATGGKTTVEIRHIELKRGKKFDEWLEETGGAGTPPIWAKANSIGRGPRPLATPSNDALSDADEQMRRAMQEDGGGTDMGPPTAPRDPDDIPFITSDIRAEVRR
jgi:hypothetical protein